MADIRRYLTHTALRIIRLLLDESSGAHTAYSIAGRLELQRSTIQWQLDRLLESGWVTKREERGTQYRVLYSMTPAGIDEGWDALRALGAGPSVRVFFGVPARGSALGVIGIST